MVFTNDTITSLMKLKSSKSLENFCCFGLLVLIVVSSGLTITVGIAIFRNTEKELKLVYSDFSHEILSNIEETAESLSPVNSSARNLAAILSSSLDGLDPSLSSIQNRVAPVLFHALSTMPQLSHISYNGSNGLFFSYYNIHDKNQTFAIYSNYSSSVNKASMRSDSTTNLWYNQKVSRTTGEVYGEPTVSTHPPKFIAITSSTSLLHQEGGQDSTNDGNISLESGWLDIDNDTLLVNRARMDRGGTISMGFLVKSVVEFFSGMDYHGGNLLIATKNGKILFGGGNPNTRVNIVGDNGTLLSYNGNVTCDLHSLDSRKGSVARIVEADYMVYCSSFELIGVPSVYVLALPRKGEHNHNRLALVLLELSLGLNIVLSVALVLLVCVCFRASRREKMHLRAAQIKQMEATQQAERKSLNKSKALDNASHDVRNLLAALSGLIQACYDYVSPGTELASLLRRKELLINDILNIVNSVLDASKIEAGKVHLEEDEFDLAEFVEEQVDAYHHLALNKGVDLMLDLCDGSLFKYSKVKGDRTKLMQILSNLLTNAVKFTAEGHVVVRVWAKKPSSITDTVLSSSRNRLLSCFSRLMAKDSELDTPRSVNGNVQGKENSMEFIFEVDDTGVGIPKEKRNYVFENYVQIKEKDDDHKGTGLGLGTVQSLVRVMGGEIEIVDKDMGERGTCFRFNILLGTSNTESNSNAREDETESSESYVSCDSVQRSGFFTRATPSPKCQASHVVLFLKGAKRREISQNFMEKLGIKVYPVEHIEHLSPTLKKIKQKLNLSLYSSSGRSNVSSKSDISIATLKDVPLSALDGTERSHPLPHRRSFVCVVIDSNAARFHDISRAVAEFRRDLRDNCSSIIWLDAPGSRIIQSKNLSEQTLPPMDHVIFEPFHGSRLLNVIILLPEFRGTVLGFTPKWKVHENQDKKFSRGQWGEIDEQDGHGGWKSYKGKEVVGADSSFSIEASTSTMKPLFGKNILVVDDAEVMLMLSTRLILSLGASVEDCDSGEQALSRVLTALRTRRIGREASSESLYDYILMDCEMPVMDGFEATRRIREAEKDYGIRIPIIALTAHTTGEETNKMKTVGMDFHIVKPLRKETLMEAIAHIDSRRR